MSSVQHLPSSLGDARRPHKPPRRPAALAQRAGQAGPRWSSFALLPLAAVAAGFVIVYLLVASTRVRYPYELEWMESGLLAHVHRIRMGQPIYVAPSVGFVPYPYPPFYVAVSALLSHIVAPPLRAMRVVSLASSLASMSLIGAVVRRETGRAGCGVVAAGLFAATYNVAGAWFDVGRVDSLYMALTLGALTVARWAPDRVLQAPSQARRRAALAGLLLALAVLTKQTAIFAVPAVVLWLAWPAPATPALRVRLWVWCLGAFGAVAGGVSLILELASHGWYGYWVVGQLAGQRLVSAKISAFWSMDLGRTVAVAGLAGLAGVLWTARRAGSRGAVMRRFWLPVMAALVLAACVSRIHDGGDSNALIPAFAAVALMSGLSLGSALDVIDSGRVHRGLRTALAASLLLVGLAQADRLRYNPTALIPTAADRRAGQQFTAYVRALPGSVWIPVHDLYAEMAGKGDAANSSGIDDVVQGGDRKVSGPLLESVHAALVDHRYAAILLDGRRGFEGFPDFATFYRCRPVGVRPPLALSGFRTRPDRICTPR